MVVRLKVLNLRIPFIFRKPGAALDLLRVQYERSLPISRRKSNARERLLQQIGDENGRSIPRNVSLFMIADCDLYQ